VDFDGDGHADLLSGSWPGELYFFRGHGNGSFAAAETLTDANGNKLNLGSASTVFAFDWDGDGKRDLLVGNIDGKVLFVPNESGAKPAFGKAQALKAEGKEIAVAHGDSHPIAVDWNRDGKPDLVVGCGDGSVVWYRNVGTKTAPQLEAARVLLPKPGEKALDRATPEQRGMRAKVCVADWNGDGHQDLLVGDFSSGSSKAPELTPAEQEAKRAVEKKLQTVITDLQPYFAELRKLGRLPENVDERSAWEKKRDELVQRYQKNLNELEKVQEELAKYRPAFQYHGYVWLLLAQPARTAAAP
jgi:hypothetical protein